MVPVTFYGVFGHLNAIPLVCANLAKGLVDLGHDVELFDVTGGDKCQAVPELEGRFTRTPDYNRLAIIHGFPMQGRSHTVKHPVCIGGFVADGTPVGTIFSEVANRQTVAAYFPSSWSRLAYISSGYTKPARIIPHGVPVGCRPRAWRHMPGSVLNVLMLTPSVDMVHRKGLREAVSAVNSLGGRVVLTLRTSERHRNVVETVFREEGADASRFILDTRPGMSPTEMVNYLHTFDAVLVPSRCEGAGMVAKEALACGVPVVTTFITGHSDYLPAPGAVEIMVDGTMVPATAFGVMKGARYYDITAEAVRDALKTLLDGYTNLEAAARANAFNFYVHHHWKNFAGDLSRFAEEVMA